MAAEFSAQRDGPLAAGLRSRSFAWAALAALLLLPVAGLVLLLAVPALDVMYHHDPMHFWLVLAAALLNVGLGYLTSEIARRQGDARLFFVSMALLSGAAFLGLHALATPGVLLQGSNAGFVVANPVGLLLAAVFAAASALGIGSRAATLRWQGWIKGGLVAVVALWAVVSLSGLPPLGKTGPSQQLPEGLQLLGIPALALYGFAAISYGLLYRRKRRTLLLAVVVAYILLAEAMIAVVLSGTWSSAWWEWHVLMLIAFATIAFGARTEYRRAHSLAGAFGGLYLDRTLEQIDRRRADALASLVAALRAEQPLSPILDGLRRQWASPEELALLERAANQLKHTAELFRPYVSPLLAEGLEEHPELAALGGEEREVSVLFADLSGFTAFSEKHHADEVITMLNTYWGATVPVVGEREGGLIERFAGDAIMVVFNALTDQPDHVLRAARAALGMRDEVMRVAQDKPGWPRFRIGVNTGPAVVGNVGADRMRSFTAIGDTTNLSARLQAQARPGHIVIGGTTREILGDLAQVERLGTLELKGKREPVEAFELNSLSA